VDKNTQIRLNASAVLKNLRLEQIVNNYGTLLYTGSYVLDLMTWNDIDMQIQLHKGVDPKKAFVSILGFIMESGNFVKSQIINFQGQYKPAMPRGIYLGFEMDFPEYGGMWKFDLWSLASEDFNKNRMLIEKIQEELTPEKRKLILSLKQEMQSKEGRVPHMGSHFLYQAVILHRLNTPKEIYQFLTENGVNIGKTA